MRDIDFYYTMDGSVGLYSYQDEDIYHSKYGAITESWEKFILPADIYNKLTEHKDLKVLDICYGIGYNTKSLMSYIINKKNISDNKFKKILKKNNSKKYNPNSYIETIDSDNIKQIDSTLINNIDTIDDDNNYKIFIDCIDMNEELIKISPLIKTFYKPLENFIKFTPRFLKQNIIYKNIKNLLIKKAINVSTKNKKELKKKIKLDLKNDIKIAKSEYRVNKYVNRIILYALLEKYKNEYIDVKLEKLITKKRNFKFFNRDMIKYAKFLQKHGYNFNPKNILSLFLHNIYYAYLSSRYLNDDFKTIQRHFKLHFIQNDARKALKDLNSQYDLIFLDAFTYTKAPELWTCEFISELYNHISSDGIIVTYSNSALVRNTFLLNNFYVGRIYNEQTQKFEGTIASKNKSKIKYPLTETEIGLCKTTAGIPYNDPDFKYSKNQILKSRQIKTENCNLISSTKYLKNVVNKNKAVRNV